MPRIAWETDVEFYDRNTASDPFGSFSAIYQQLQAMNLENIDPVVEVPLDQLQEQERVAYIDITNRLVVVRILGSVGVNPKVLVSKVKHGGGEKLMRGLLIGSFNEPGTDDILPGVIKTGHHPALRPYRAHRQASMLPVPSPRMLSIPNPTTSGHYTGE